MRATSGSPAPIPSTGLALGDLPREGLPGVRPWRGAASAAPRRATSPYAAHRRGHSRGALPRFTHDVPPGAIPAPLAPPALSGPLGPLRPCPARSAPSGPVRPARPSPVPSGPVGFVSLGLVRLARPCPALSGPLGLVPSGWIAHAEVAWRCATLQGVMAAAGRRRGLDSLLTGPSTGTVSRSGEDALCVRGAPNLVASAVCRSVHFMVIEPVFVDRLTTGRDRNYVRPSDGEARGSASPGPGRGPFASPSDTRDQAPRAKGASSSSAETSGRALAGRGEGKLLVRPARRKCRWRLQSLAPLATTPAAAHDSKGGAQDGTTA